MLRARRLTATAALVAAASLGFSWSAQAAPADGSFDTTPHGRYYSGGQPVALDGSWSVPAGGLLAAVRTPFPAAPGAPQPSAPNSVKLGNVSSFTHGGQTQYQLTAGNLVRVVSTTPGGTCTVTALAAQGPKNDTAGSPSSQIGVFGWAQNSPDVADYAPSEENRLEGGGLDSLPASADNTLNWQRREWTIRPTSAYTAVQVLEGPFGNTWVDDLQVSCTG